MQGDTGNVQKTMGYSLPKVLEAARSAMSTLGDSFVSAEALLLGLAKEDDRFTTKAFLKQDIKYTDISDAVVKFREKAGPIISRSAENNYDALLKYGVDFTERAEQGKLDPVIGRDDEIRRAIQILSRRTKNNPVLIGDPGGKFIRASMNLKFSFIIIFLISPKSFLLFNLLQSERPPLPRVLPSVWLLVMCLTLCRDVN